MKSRKNIIKLKPYTCARDVYTKGLFLDFNENFRQWVKIDWLKVKNLNKYASSSSADPLRQKLCQKYTKGFKKENIFVGCGSDEIIDLLIRGFVESNEYVMVMDPTYSVYQVQADINKKRVKKVLLRPDFNLNIKEIASNIKKVKLLFLCSPNNPTGNLISRKDIKKIIKFYKGIIVIDEAYIEFAGLKNSLADLVKNNSQLVVIRTFSKAWGLAGIRLGYAIASPQIIEVLLKVKDPYNISNMTQSIVLQALDQLGGLKESVSKTMSLKKTLESDLRKMGLKLIPTKTNFILLRVKNSNSVYKQLANKGIVVRDRGSLTYLKNVLRVTVGSSKDNKKFINVLKEVL